MKKIIVPIIIIVFICFLAIIAKNINQSPYDLLVSSKSDTRAKNPTELLYQTNIGNNEHLIFVVNENNNLASAIIETGVFTSNILKVSSEVSANGPDPYNILFSSYNKGQNWIYWGSIIDEGIKQILIDNSEASIIETGDDFRLFYFLGTDSVESTLPEYEVIY